MKQDIIGRKYNKLTIIEHVAYRRVKCKCDCGKEKECDYYEIRRNKVKSCGCARNSPELRELARKRAYDLQEKGLLNKGGDFHTNQHTTFKYILKCIKNKNRINKSSDVSLSDLEELWNNQKGLCAYTNIELILPTHTNLQKDIPKWKIASIDRINSSEGYNKHNIQFVSVTINYAKNNMSHEEMIKFLHFIKNDAILQ